MRPGYSAVPPIAPSPAAQGGPRRMDALPSSETSIIRVAIGAAPVQTTVPHLWLAPHPSRKAAITGRLRLKRLRHEACLVRVGPRPPRFLGPSG